MSQWMDGSWSIPALERHVRVPYWVRSCEVWNPSLRASHPHRCRWKNIAKRISYMKGYVCFYDLVETAKPMSVWIVRSFVCRKTRTSSLDTRFFERIHNGRFTQSPTHDMMCYCIMLGDMIWHGMIWSDTTLYETTSWVWRHDNMISQYDFMSYQKMWWHWWVLMEKIQ